MENSMKMMFTQELMPDRILFFGGQQWTVLSVDRENRRILLYVQSWLHRYQHVYNKDMCSWDESELKKWLNEEIYQKLSDDEKDSLIDTGTGFIFVPSKDEYDRYFKGQNVSENTVLRPLKDDSTLTLVRYSREQETASDQELSCIPCAWVSFDQGIFKGHVCEDGEKLFLEHNALLVKDGVLKGVLSGVKDLTLPEGIEEIDCRIGYYGCKSVSLPASLKKVNGCVFDDFGELKYLEIKSKDVVFNAKDYFRYPEKITADPSVFRTPQRLPSAFLSLCRQADATSLSWLLIYQKSKVFDRELKKYVTKTNINDVVLELLERLKEAEYPKPMMTTISKVAAEYQADLKPEVLNELISVFKAHKAEKLTEAFKKSESGAEQLIEKREVKPGTLVYLKDIPYSWTVLDVDYTRQKIVMIANYCAGNYLLERNEQRLKESCHVVNFSLETIAKISKDPEDQKLRILTEQQFEKYRSYIRPISEVFDLSDWRPKNWAILLDDDPSKTISVDKYNEIDHSESGAGSDYRPYIVIDFDSSLIDIVLEADKPIFLAKPFELSGHTIISSNPGFSKITVPEGIEAIGERAFYNRRDLVSITLPESLKAIDAGAFGNCEKLAEVIMKSHQVSYGKDIFWDVPHPYTDRLFQTTGKLPQDFFVHLNKVKETETVGWIILYHSEDKWLNALSDRLESKDKDVVFKWMFERFKQDAKKSDKLGLNIVRFLSVHFENVDRESADEFVKIATESKLKKTLEFLDKNSQISAWLSGNDDSCKEEKIAQKILKDLGTNVGVLDSRLKGLFGVMKSDLPSLMYKDGSEVSEWLRAFLIVVHGTEDEYCYREHGLMKGVDEIVASLDEESLKTFLRSLGSSYLGMGNSKKLNMAFPICRYADEIYMKELCALAPKWASSVSGIDAPPLRIFRQAVMYSNTLPAMLLADRYHELYRYAKLRGMGEDEYRDLYLSDVGLSADGTKELVLGDMKVLAVLQDNLSYLIKVPGKEKLSKSLPKGGIDPKDYETANEEFKLLKNSTKKIVKAQADALLGHFLKGDGKNAEIWKNVYLNNPLLRSVGRIVVWKQEERLFTIGDEGTIDVNGAGAELNEQMISVAHPMDMDRDTLRSWQDFFVSRDLKQPFRQLWEPMIDFDKVNPDRYEGAEVDAYRFSGKEKHGMSARGIYAYSDDFSFTLKDISIDYDNYADERYDTRSFYFKLGKIKSFEKSRYSNHVLSLLDEWTFDQLAEKMIVDRDVTFRGRIDTLNRAQVDQLIELSNKLEATDMTSSLMTYKSEHFSDDVFDDFTLDL